MAAARSRDEWNRTSHVLALLATLINFKLVKEEHRLSMDPAKYTPYGTEPPADVRPAERVNPAIPITVLKAVFVDNQPESAR